MNVHTYLACKMQVLTHTQFESNEHFSIEEIANETNISLETVQSIISDLEKELFVYSGDEGVYHPSENATAWIFILEQYLGNGNQPIKMSELYEAYEVSDKFDGMPLTDFVSLIKELEDKEYLTRLPSIEVTDVVSPEVFLALLNGYAEKVSTCELIMRIVRQAYGESSEQNKWEVHESDWNFTLIKEFGEDDPFANSTQQICFLENIEAAQGWIKEFSDRESLDLFMKELMRRVDPEDIYEGADFAMKWLEISPYTMMEAFYYASAKKRVIVAE